MTFDQAISLTRRFHKRVSAPIADRPCLLPCDPVKAEQVAVQLNALSRSLLSDSSVLLQRAGMALEELSEWLTAHARGNLVAAADGLADRQAVVFGDAVATGLPIEALFREVMASNLSKDRAGRTGKAIKGPDYRPPDIKRVLEEYHG